MSFFAELKQRKVVRVTTIYLVTAWLAIQVASIALPAFEAPPWVLRVLILVFALGLPLTLVLTWALEVTPEGIRVEASGVGTKRVFATALGLVALALAWYFVGQPALRSGDAAPAAAAAPKVDERSIAVLPFVNMSGDKANDYFSDGLAETTLDMLAQVKDLRVIARTSSFALKGKNEDMREVGRKLGAANLLEGSVQQSGDTVRVTVQLIRAAEGTHLWSSHFDRPMADLFKIQDEVATAVVQALQVALSKPEQDRLTQKRTDNVAAYQEYLRGVALLPDRKVAEMREAARHFERAIELDPGYARAYVGAADAYELLQEYATVSEDERERSKRYVARALELAPELGEAHTAHAQVLGRDSDLVAAEAEYRRGVELAPNYASGNQWYAEFLGNMGRFDEALRLLRKAKELDPLSPVVADTYIFMLSQSGSLDQALALEDKQIAAHPDIARQYSARSQLDEQRGDMAATLADLSTCQRLEPDSIGCGATRCHVMIDFGALPEARACVAAYGEGPSSQFILRNAKVRLAAIDLDLNGALALLADAGHEADGYRSALFLLGGRPAETLAIERRRFPQLFAEPPGRIWPGEAWVALNVGIGLTQTGEKGKAETLLHAALDAVAKRPYGAFAAGRGWLDAYAWTFLGDKDRAIDALKAAVDAGYFIGVAELDADPLLKQLHADPRYQKVLAPARAKAGEQVEAARKAGVL